MHIAFSWDEIFISQSIYKVSAAHFTTNDTKYWYEHNVPSTAFIVRRKFNASNGKLSQQYGAKNSIWKRRLYCWVMRKVENLVISPLIGVDGKDIENVCFGTIYLHKPYFFWTNPYHA